MRMKKMKKKSNNKRLSSPLFLTFQLALNVLNRQFSADIKDVQGENKVEKSV